MPNTTEYNATKQSGLVISYFGNSVAVEAADGQVFQCQLHRNQELPVVGDHVLWQKEETNNCTIDSILPRKSLMARGSAKGQKKALAANIDAIIIVMGPPPILSEQLIDRYLIAAELLGIEPIIIVNKKDLLGAAEKEQVLLRLKDYTNVPYQTYLTSVTEPEGLNQLSNALANKSVVLIGPSGVGKSSIIAALCQQDLKIGEISTKGAGKHTTTATRLYHLPNGGSLIDSPGVREFNLWPITKDEVIASFKEFQIYLNKCKFRDCQHLTEPDCAVKAAVSEGKLSQQRYKNYLTLMQTATDAKHY